MKIQHGSWFSDSTIWNAYLKSKTFIETCKPDVTLTAVCCLYREHGNAAFQR